MPPLAASLGRPALLFITSNQAGAWLGHSRRRRGRFMAPAGAQAALRRALPRVLYPVQAAAPSAGALGASATRSSWEISAAALPACRAPAPCLLPGCSRHLCSTLEALFTRARPHDAALRQLDQRAANKRARAALRLLSPHSIELVAGEP